MQDLRKMIVQNGGVFHAYLDKKSLVYVHSMFISHYSAQPSVGLTSSPAHSPLPKSASLSI